MSAPKGLYKTTIVIWSDFPASGFEIDDLAREAMTGEAYCSSQETEYITNQNKFPSTEFFDSPDEDELEPEPDLERDRR